METRNILPYFVENFTGFLCFYYNGLAYIVVCFLPPYPINPVEPLEKTAARLNLLSECVVEPGVKFQRGCEMPGRVCDGVSAGKGLG